MGAIIQYLLQMVLPALLGALLWAMTRPLRTSLREKKKFRVGNARELALLIYFMFTAGLLALTLTPEGFWAKLMTGQPLPPWRGLSLDRLNLAPFRETWKQYRYYARRGLWTILLVNFLGNILMFLPNGFFAALLMEKPCWWKSILATFGLSLFIETFQLLVSRGSDVDDLILNSFGGLCGYCGWLLFRHIAPDMALRCAKTTEKGSD